MTLIRGLLSIFGAVVASILAGIIFNNYFQKNAELVYSVKKVSPVESKQEGAAIYYISLSNNGEKEVKKVTADIKLSSGTITDKSIKYDRSMHLRGKLLSKDNYRLEMDTLNPKEQVSVSLFVVGKVEEGAEPSISLRGEGVNGKPEVKKGTEKEGVEKIVEPYTAIALGLIQDIADYLPFK